MKKNIISILVVCLTSVAAQAGFLGKMGPFEENQKSTKTIHFEQCVTVGELKFHVEKSAKYHIPRVLFDAVHIRYMTGNSTVVEGKHLGAVRGFQLEIDEAKGCITDIALSAQDAGFNPGRANESYVEIWGW